MDLLEVWIRRAATALGLLALLLPLVRLWRRRHAARGRVSGSAAFMTRWPAIFVLSTAYVSVGVLLWKPIPIMLTMQLRWFLILVGALSYVPGIALYVWGFWTLGTMFGASSGMSAQLYQGHRLVETGPYAAVRHPMYLGVILAAVGALLIFRTWAMALYAPSAFGIIVRARREDSLLAMEFGEAWAAYRDRVPGWIPRIGKRYELGG